MVGGALASWKPRPRAGGLQRPDPEGAPTTNPGPDSPAACGLCTTPEHTLRRVRLWVLRQIPHKSRFCGLFACPKTSFSTWRLPGLHRPVGGHDEPLVALEPYQVVTEGLNFSSYLIIINLNFKTSSVHFSVTQLCFGRTTCYL